MAAYKYNEILTWSNDQGFDLTLNPGVAVPHSRIYRCTGYGHEVASNAGDPLPPQNHHQHSPDQGAIRWCLAVMAEGSRTTSH